MKRRFTVGDKIGRLTLLEYLGTDEAQKRLVMCECECGNKVTIRLNNLGRKTNSCGCLKADLIRQNMGKPIEDLAARHVLNSCKRHTPTTDLTLENVKSLIYTDCFYCEMPPELVGRSWERPIADGRHVWRIGIDRVDNNKGYFMDNVVSCCKDCNYIKRNHTPKQLLQRLEVFIENLRKLT